MFSHILWSEQWDVGGVCGMGVLEEGIADFRDYKKPP
jgi:hypothetical protein